ncbi:MAG TPA: tryptophan 7-halogenase [Micromonosporaceae bacterium]|nr:tryptophan 7-halogenase [Micromonosporaceae bacterium]
MRVVVVGGSAAGLFTSLLLARAGHEVVVLDRDPLEPARDVEDAAESAFRAAAPQIVQPHVVLSLCRELMLERLPDVYDDLVAAGVAQAPLSTQMAPSLPDRSGWPGDERLTLLMTRRATLDWVLRRAAAEQSGVTVRGGVAVTGLRARPGDPPYVTGVQTDDGQLDADLVVDATGRRSPIDRWLTAIDARPTATVWAECGLAYYSRHYRLRTDSDLPGPTATRIVAGLDEFTVGIWGEDNSTMVCLIAPMADDKRFRAVRDPDVFTAVLRTVPIYAQWLDVLEPATPIYPMGGLHNTFRRLVVDGTPVAYGLHAIGDTVCTTNPTLGRGLSLALREAADLVDELANGYDQPADLARVLHERVERQVAPFYDDQAAIDAQRLAELRHRIFDAPPPSTLDAPDRVTYAQLRNAAPFDPAVFRAFWKVMGMVCRPETVYTDPEIVVRTHEAIRTHGAGPPIAQPSRADVLAALGSQT